MSSTKFWNCWLFGILGYFCCNIWSKAVSSVLHLKQKPQISLVSFRILQNIWGEYPAFICMQFLGWTCLDKLMWIMNKNHSNKHCVHSPIILMAGGSHIEYFQLFGSVMHKCVVAIKFSIDSVREYYYWELVLVKTIYFFSHILHIRIHCL